MGLRRTTGTDTTYGQKSGWGQAGTLIAGDPHGQVTAQANLEEGGTMTAYFQVTPNPASNNPIYVAATVIWRIAGHEVVRKITVGNGSSITGVAEGVRIILTDATAAFVSQAPPSPPITPVPYSVNVQFALGARGTNKQPPVLIPSTLDPSSTGAQGQGGVFTVNAAGTAVIPIDTTAGVISTYITVISEGTNPAFGLYIADFMYNATRTKAYEPRQYPDWVPVTPGANFLRLGNADTSPALFSVTFGIDG